ncbi:MAG: hypothetical protein ABH830_01845 [Patescibacteria group bacterium]
MLLGRKIKLAEKKTLIGLRRISELAKRKGAMGREFCPFAYAVVKRMRIWIDSVSAETHTYLIKNLYSNFVQKKFALRSVIATNRFYMF